MQLARSTPREKVVAGLSMLVWIGACSDGPTADTPLPAEIRLLSPATQSGTPGWPLSDSIIVEVLDADGNALHGVPVVWSASNGADKIGRPADTTNIAGRAAAEWTLGWIEGEQSLSIRAGNLAPLTVTATATIFHAADVTVGGGFACALTQTGRAFCWGRNRNGQLGNGAAGDWVGVPAAVEGDLVFTALTASGGHVCGLTVGGVAHCWGSNGSGETGTGTRSQSVTTPTPVQTPVRFSHLSAEGVGAYYNSTCGLTETSEGWCWGDNTFAKLGDGTNSNSTVPVRVFGDVQFSYLQTGYFHSCGTARSGELWCWGEQEADTGAFGERPEGLYPAPVVVHPDFRFAQVSNGRNYTCGLTAQHSAFCWGANWFGSLGTDPPTDATPTPLPVAGGHVFVKLSAAGFESTHGLTSVGVVYRWGSPGNDIPQPTPVSVTDLRFIRMDSGEEPFFFTNGFCGITADYAVYCVDSSDNVRGVPPPATP